MNNCAWTFLLCIGCLLPTALTADEPKVPATVKELFADFYPRTDALDAKVVGEWEKDEIVYRSVTYHIGTFQDKPARMAAFSPLPKGAKKLPGLLHLHGGGSGFRTEPRPRLPQVKMETPNGDVNLFNATIGFESYAPNIKAPLQEVKGQAVQ